MKNRKLYSLLSVCAMTFSIMAAVNAEGSNVAKVGDAEYSDLQAAVNTAESGATVELISDINDLEPVTINADRNITLDLAGHTIKAGSKSDGSHYYVICNKGTMTLKDSSAAGTGKIVARGTENYGTMTIESGTIESCDSNGGGAAVWNESTESETATLYVKGGTLSFTGTQLNDSAGVPINNQSNSVVYITGGSLISPYTCILNGGSLEAKDITLSNSTGHWNCVKNLASGTMKLNNVTFKPTNGGAIEAYGGTVDITDCTVTQSGFDDHNSSCVAASGGGIVNIHSGTYVSDAGYGFYVFNSGGTINVLSDDVSVTAPQAALRADNSLTSNISIINISGGNINGSLAVGDQSTLSVSGGSFTADISNYLVAGSSCIKAGDRYEVASNANGTRTEAFEPAEQEGFADIMSKNGYEVKENLGSRADKISISNQLSFDKVFVEYTFKSTNNEEKKHTVTFDLGTTITTDGSAEIGIILYNIPTDVEVLDPVTYIR